MWNALRATKSGHYANKCLESKAKYGKASMKVHKIEDFKPKLDSEAKSVRQIRIWYSFIEEKSSDPFMRHWIILSKDKSDWVRIIRVNWHESLLIPVQIAIPSPESSILSCWIKDLNAFFILVPLGMLILIWLVATSCSIGGQDHFYD